MRFKSANTGAKKCFFWFLKLRGCTIWTACNILGINARQFRGVSHRCEHWAQVLETWAWRHHLHSKRQRGRHSSYTMVLFSQYTSTLALGRPSQNHIGDQAFSFHFFLRGNLQLYTMGSRYSSRMVSWPALVVLVVHGTLGKPKVFARDLHHHRMCSCFRTVSSSATTILEMPGIWWSTMKKRCYNYYWLHW